MIDFDEVALKLAKAEADNIILMKALKTALESLYKINNRRSVAMNNLQTAQGETLNAGNIFCWATIDDMHNTIQGIKRIYDERNMGI